MMKPKQLKQIEIAQNKLFKKFKMNYVPYIAFQDDKQGWLGTIAIWLLKRVGATIKLQVIETK